ncbi:uncharacterized protein SCHCODRAFT_02557851, partial [Schizophyllum commune H4-8]|uniref:uncharacterized protein n=1 Tax=Schizophyllum commune (strain H4-8 / FGSC 9210) TaxID=578458 RepID=UPI00215E1BF0
MEDEDIPEQERTDLIDHVQALLSPLEEFLRTTPFLPNLFIPREYTGKRGRPRYILNLERAIALHDLGNSWEDVATAMGVARSTLYEHMDRAGLSSARRDFTAISNEELDELVTEFSRLHPFSGSAILMGDLEARGIHLPRARVQESLRRVDAIGVLVRFAGLIRRKVYHVRGANALWHQDGNEKLKPWGFWVHGCIDGHSRLIIYLACTSNKRQATVGALWKNAVETFGWPSRARGDFGSENNEIERMMIRHWGADHRAYLRGRSLHNVRIERLWRDVRKDVLEVFRQIFLNLEDREVLDMEDPIHRACLFLTFQHRIQRALDRAADAWNHHKIRTEGNRTPLAIYELSREFALNRGYWTGDAGDLVESVGAMYGSQDHGAPVPPTDEVVEDPIHPREEPEGVQAQKDAGIVINDDAELEYARSMLPDFDFMRDDGNW